MYTIRLSKTNEQFLNDYGWVFEKYPTRTQLMAINLLNPMNESHEDQFMGGVYEKGQLVLLFNHPYQFYFQIFSLKPCEEAVKQLVVMMKEKNIKIKGVQGNATDLRSFFSYDLTRYIKTRSLDIMRLDHLVKPNLCLQMRKARVEDLPSLVQIRRDFLLEALGEKEDSSVTEERVKRSFELDQYYLLVNEQSEIVSLAMTSRKLYKGIAISLVYTQSRYRNLGYSSSLVYQMCHDLFIRGYQYMTLFVDKNNPISNHVYKKLGFYIVDDFYEYEKSNS